MASKNEEKDVLEFLDSLPTDSNGNASSSGSGEKDKDILNFLDELAQESQASSASLKPVKNFDYKDEPITPNSENFKDDKTTTTIKEETPKPEEESKEDQGASWWGGSAKQLNSFWGSASHVVGDLSKTAQETVSDISKVANDQLKDLKLIDEEDLDLLNKGKQSFLTNIDGQQQKVNGYLQSFVSTINQQIKSTASNMNHYDETLKIYIINDGLKNFNYIDYSIYNNFQKVFGQVDGSINLEIVNSKNFSKLLNILDLVKLTSNSDLDLKPKEIDFFNGSVNDAEKLSFANIDEGIKSLMELKKAEKAKEPEESLQNDNKKTSSRTSHIFINIVPIVPLKPANSYSSNFEEIIKIDDVSAGNFQFLLTLKDLEHKFSIVTKSQAYPLKWAKWITTNKLENDDEKSKDESEKEEEEEEDIGVEPSEWVKDWIKDGLELSIGVLVQSYVTKRMGY